MKTTSQSSSKPQRAVFLLAAEMTHTASTDDHQLGVQSRFCCDNLNRLGAKLGYLTWNTSPEITLFTDLFKPENAGLGWWDWAYMGTVGHDFESRILALLLCAEMCRPVRVAPHRRQPKGKTRR